MTVSVPLHTTTSVRAATVLVCEYAAVLATTAATTVGHNVQTRRLRERSRVVHHADTMTSSLTFSIGQESFKDGDENGKIAREEVPDAFLINRA